MDHMDTFNNRKDTLWQYTLLALIITLVISLVEIVIGLATDKEATYTIAGVFILFRNSPVYWIILIITLFTPVTIYFLVGKLTKQISDLQQAFEHEQDRLSLINNYTHQLIQENFEIDLQLAREDDILGKSILELRDTLKKGRDNNLRIRKEEEQRNWIADGSAHLSEILRNYIHDPEQLAFIVIKDLTKYINAIQGGFYLLDDTDPSNKFFNLKAFFAYDRRKFTDQQIKWGDGLIGTCALEQKIIHLNHLPGSYISVTSGLGEANPDSLLIVPMQFENQIYGVFEFASLGKFESNHIVLVEKTAESVAATLSAVRTNLKTARLLEESKAQTQALTSHEEEMRQNMEELQATQEEATRQAQRFLVLEESINQNLIRADFDRDGRLVNANSLFISKFEYGKDAAIEGRHILDFISEDNRDQFKEILDKLLRKDEAYKGYIKHVTRTGKDLWTIAALSTSRNDDPSLDKIMFLAIDTSDERNRIQKNELIIESINSCGIRFELDIIGNLLNCNEGFKQVFKLSQKDIKSLVIFDIINPIELEAFNKRWDTIIKGNTYTGMLRGKNTDGGELWLTGSFTPSYNMVHEIESIIFIGNDITHEKQLETEAKTQNEVLKKQEKLLRDAEKELTSKIRDTRAELLNQFKITERIKNLNEKILEDSPDAIVTTGHNNRIVLFNRAAEQLWNIDRNEVLQQDVSILFPEKLTDKDELIGSFTRPGDHKIIGQQRNSLIINKKGQEKRVKILLAKARVDNENAYTAFIQKAD